MTGPPTESYVVVMPRLGLSMTQGTIVEWNKQDGEWVDKGDDLFTFESDKSAIVIEAPASGPLHILVEVGKTVDVQTPVAVIGDDSELEEEWEGGSQAHREERPSVAAAEVQGGKRRGIAASPRARAQAKARGIDLAGLRGTGIRGMIVVSDLEHADVQPAILATPVARRLAAEAGLDLSRVSGSGPQRRITRVDVERALAGPSTGAQGLTGLRAIIADRLSTGWRERPQVTLNTEADAVNLIARRDRLSQELGDKVPFDVLFVRIAAMALSEFRYMNATLTPSGIEELPNINIGVAADTDRGLLVPVLHRANQLTLAEMHHSLAELSERAQSGTSLPDDLSGGTFTITNLGMFGVDAFTPIINPPETAILGIGRIVLRPTAWDGRVALREQLTLSLSFDHRLVDGAPAARFLARIRDLIEQPSDLFGES
jgi:pyruvate dehydrogenase E2 component (dihydrolipoamide acetyltransferase)